MSAIQTNQDLLPGSVRESLDSVLQHFTGDEWEDMLNHVRENGNRSHVFVDLRRLSRWMSQPAQNGAFSAPHTVQMTLAGTVLEEHELAGVLVGLRLHQQETDFDRFPQYTEEGLAPLTPAEVDVLCERINSDGGEHLALDSNQLAAVLVGLRLHQEQDSVALTEFPQYGEADLGPLTEDEAEELCQRLNCAGAEIRADA